MKKRGQAALEFLTTYGWAFLVILVMIAALAYFGVLDPGRYLPDKCQFNAGVGCVDSFADKDENYLQLKLINNYGTAIRVLPQTAQGHVVLSEDRLCPAYQNKEMSLAGQLIWDAGDPGAEGEYLWQANEVVDIRIGDVDGTNCPLIIGERPVIEVKIAYS